MSYDSKFSSPENDSLFEAILLLSSKEECYRFFEDLMSIKELQAVSQRWQVAEMLSKGCTYNDIRNKTGASVATISRVSKTLSYGADGYKLMLRNKETQHSPDIAE